MKTLLNNLMIDKKKMKEYPFSGNILAKTTYDLINNK
jgi:hypothetical protein